MRRKNASPARAAMKLLCTLLGVILVVMLSATLYFQHLMGQINPLDAPAFSLDLPDVDLQGLLPDGQSSKIGGSGSGIVNILLIGQDAREGETQARSDSMILCTFQKDTSQLIMTSFLRDLYVPIPGYQSNRINAAYAAGGMPLLEKTLETNFGLHIDGGVEVDFSEFSDIINLLGGVSIELRQDEADFINKETGSSLTQGLHTLDGKQALTYSRIRSLDGDGDFSRTNRQRKVLSALLDVYKNSSLTTMFTLLDDILPVISTDMSTGRILTLALELFPHLSDAQIVSQYVPSEGTYTNQSIDGMSVLVADTEAVRAMLERTLLPEA